MGSEIKIRSATPRPLPRPFKFHWGGGVVIEEASVRCELTGGRSWEPTIQLLHYDNGEQTLRFCVFEGRRLTRLWPLMDKDVLSALSKEVNKNAGIKNLLKSLVTSQT